MDLLAQYSHQRVWSAVATGAVVLISQQPESSPWDLRTAVNLDRLGICSPGSSAAAAVYMVVSPSEKERRTGDQRIHESLVSTYSTTGIVSIFLDKKET